MTSNLTTRKYFTNRNVSITTFKRLKSTYLSLDRRILSTRVSGDRELSLLFLLILSFLVGGILLRLL